MCGTSSATKTAASQQTAFTNRMLDQASTVFGADNGVFNAMSSAYSNLLAAGPSQHGFSAAQLSAQNASAITNVANQERFAMGQAKTMGASTPGGVGRFGGGQATGESGVGIPAASAATAQYFGGMESNALNQITQADWAQGNKNWITAGQGLQAAPGSFTNMKGFNDSAQTGLDQNMANAQASDAASNWWVKPVESLAGAGLTAATGGLGGMMMGGTFAGGMGASLLGTQAQGQYAKSLGS